MNEHIPTSKRQRLAVVSKNEEAKDTHTRIGGGILTLPSGVLSNCFSFLGPSGHYYFLASVCKDFKVAVDELYDDDRNTSMNSILTSVSTCTHVMSLSDELVPDGVSILPKVITAVFENDRLDLYQDVLLKNDLTTMLFMTNAIRYKSTEIMRSIITNEQIIYLLKNSQPPEGMQIEATSKEIKIIVQAIVAACDPQMIHQLVEKGVVFDVSSIFHSLRRKDLETFKCLLDILGHDEVDNRDVVSIFRSLLEHEMHFDAIKYLKQKGYFDDEAVLTATIIYTIRTRAAAGENIVKALLEDLSDNIDRSFKMIISVCILSECMDVLSYIHESVKRIDIDLWIHFAERQNLTEVVAHLRSMR
ncbi:predicted protein [Chaetoceros tenuissimus]|uniref:Uncharacterized protein n=1 Tax=Chaetoceros tenuissimus TaxID=426638 RepID=A0AAD3H4G6_9STRA|nr:predicted protein [Chaetoceros tenuissimus]